MIRSYLPAVVFIGLGTILGLVFAVLNSLLGPTRRRARRAQADPYESGLPSEVKKNFRFGISFYLVAMLFILFDIETIFLFPWAVEFRRLGVFGLVEMVVFIALVVVAVVATRLEPLDALNRHRGAPPSAAGRRTKRRTA